MSVIQPYITSEKKKCYNKSRWYKLLDNNYLEHLRVSGFVISLLPKKLTLSTMDVCNLRKYERTTLHKRKKLSNSLHRELEYECIEIDHDYRYQFFK